MLVQMPSSVPARVSTTDPEAQREVKHRVMTARRRGGARQDRRSGDQAAYGCAGCAETRRTCPSCVQRRRYAWGLVNERAESVESAARIMRLSPERVQALLNEKSHRLELGSLKCDSIPVQLTRSAV